MAAGWVKDDDWWHLVSDWMAGCGSFSTVFKHRSSSAEGVYRCWTFFFFLFCADDYKASFKSWKQKNETQLCIFCKDPTTTGTLYLIVSLLLWINVDIDAKSATPLTKLTDSTWTAKNTPRETKWQQRQPFLDHMACTRATMLGPSGWFGSKICSGCSPVWHTLWQVHAKSVNAWGSHFSAC